MLTFLTLEEIDEIAKWDDSRINEKKEVLAYELTSLVHGKEEADKAQASARALFSGEGDDSNMPSTKILIESLVDGKITISDLLVLTRLCASKGEAKRLIMQGGVSINGEKVTDAFGLIDKNALKEGVKIKKGKKIFHKAYID